MKRKNWTEKFIKTSEDELSDKVLWFLVNQTESRKASAAQTLIMKTAVNGARNYYEALGILTASIMSMNEIVSKDFHSEYFFDVTDPNATKGWTKWNIELWKIVCRLPETFTINEVYAHKNRLKKKYPLNNTIECSIRKTLQELRDKGLIEFLGKGNYRKTCL